MPLPLLAIGAAILGAAGVGGYLDGAEKIKKANDTVNKAQERHKQNISRVEQMGKETTEVMDSLGELELSILSSFETFADVFEQIHNRPEFEAYSKHNVRLPKYDGEKLREVSIGADAAITGLASVGIGGAGGIAAAGATQVVIKALCTTSTGTAIKGLSGAALQKAILAKLGGGAIAVGGGGVAAGAAVLSAATWGIGLLIGGFMFSNQGDKATEQADEAWAQMEEAEKKINKICAYLEQLKTVSANYNFVLNYVCVRYLSNLTELKNNVQVLGHTDWDYFTEKEKRLTENTVLLVGLLYNMCKLELVLKGDGKDDINEVNVKGAQKLANDASVVLDEISDDEDE